MGTFLGLNANLSTAIAAQIIVVVTIGTLIASGHTSRRQLIFPAWLLTAWSYAMMTAQPTSQLELRNQMEAPSEHLSVLADIVAEPYQNTYDGQNESITYLPVRIQAIQRTPEWNSASGSLLITIKNKPENLHVEYGNRIIASGPVRLKSGPLLGLHKSHYRMTASTNSISIVASNKGNALMSHCFAMRARLANILSYDLDIYPREANILKALLLGYRSELDSELNQQFAQTGTLHIFAISGLHVGILAMLAIGLLKRFGISQPRWILFLIPLLIVFVAMTGMKASAVRAGIMATLYWGAPAIRRKPNVVTAMALAALIILLISPEQINDPGFLFSFIIVAGMITLIPTLSTLFTSWLHPDEWVPDTPQNKLGGVRRAGIWAGNYASVSVSAWLSSLPLTAYFFNLFSPIALIGNLFAVMFAFLIVSCGMLSMLLGSLWLPLAGVFNSINQKLILLLLTLIDTLNSIPHAWQYVAAPPLWIVPAYMALLAYVASRRRWHWTTGLIITTALVAWSTYLHIKDQRPYLEVLDVPPGQAVYLKPPGEPGYLIDTGSAFHARKIIQWLQQKGIDRLNGIVLTHSDINHLSGAPHVLAAFPTESLYLPGNSGNSQRVSIILDTLRQTNTPCIEWQRGNRGHLAGGIHYEVFTPGPDTAFRSADDLSMVLRLSHHHIAVLITGGMSPKLETELLRSGLDLGATVLVTPNTSDWDSVSNAIIGLIRPRDAIIAGSAFNMNEGRINRLREKQINVFRMHDFGPVRIEFDTGRVYFLSDRVSPLSLFSAP